MAPQDPQTAALLAHVVSQIEQNVNFLAEQNYISHSEASAILTKLPNVANNAGAVNNLASRMASVSMPTPSFGGGARAVPPPPAPVQQASAYPTAKALWAYKGDAADDLQFEAGDIVEIIEETNADWWTGRYNGRQGLFPSAYVEKVVQVAKSTKPYKAFGASYHGLSNTAPPPPASGATNTVGLQEKPGTEEKKDKYGAMKNTMAHSAAAGVGFGAGSAIGGGLVRAIF